MELYQMKPSHPNDVKPGLNKILVATVHYGYQHMIMEKDVPSITGTSYRY